MSVSPKAVERQWESFHPDFIKSLALGHLEARYEGEVARDDGQGFEDTMEYYHYHEYSEITDRCEQAILQEEREGCGCGCC